jgi:uncharacterized protein (TIGR00730 family)
MKRVKKQKEQRQLIEVPKHERELNSLMQYLRAQELSAADQELAKLVVTELCHALSSLSGGVGTGVAILGSARCLPDTKLYDDTLSISKRVAAAGFSVITGGASCVMEAGLKGAFDTVPTIGLNIKLPREEDNNHFQSLTADFSRFMGLRKLAFVLYSKAYIFMPGGLGTLDELFEVLTLMQTGLIAKAPVYLVGKAHWSMLVDYLRTVQLPSGVISSSDFDLFQIVEADDPFVEELLAPALRVAAS